MPADSLDGWMDGWMDGYTLVLPDKARAAESLLVAQLLSTHDQGGEPMPCSDVTRIRVHYMLHIYPMSGVFYSPKHRTLGRRDLGF